jgi:hypothetical protein
MFLTRISGEAKLPANKDFDKDTEEITTITNPELPKDRYSPIHRMSTRIGVNFSTRITRDTGCCQISY